MIRNLLIFVCLILSGTLLALFLDIFFGMEPEPMPNLAGDITIQASGPLITPDKKAAMEAQLGAITARPVFFPARGHVAAPQTHSSQKPGLHLIGLMTINGENIAIVVNNLNTAGQTAKRLYRVGDKIADKITLKEIREASVILQMSDGILEIPLRRDQLIRERGIKVNGK